MNISLLTTIIVLFVADVSSTPVNAQKNNDVCSFKDGNTFPTFLYNNDEQSEEITCTNKTCQCDGSNTGYKGCQKCCCGIRKRFEGNGIFNGFFSDTVKCVAFLGSEAVAQRCSVKSVIRNFAKFTGNCWCQSLFFHKVVGLRAEILSKNRLWRWRFPVNFARFLRTSFLKECLR